ncbi:hypothetical protein F511_27462 [Dorcoceras hygrometricum]|uniref:Uncharacterized protein n=1 Tax=Dorcoceras hygrometricum TaxID=472368 RepID=A0A2Z7B7V1_9LAMI|nr:hypothetical protein F511_27462 [Dorcoceras hygrometricum]
MENSLGPGFMAVFAVSGSVVFLAMQAHKRLLSDFMKKMEFEIKHSSDFFGEAKDVGKKKVKFSNDVTEYSTAEKGYDDMYPSILTNGGGKKDHENLETMPLNWQVLYKGILRHKNLRVDGV